jgi:hypothetical protein
MRQSGALVISWIDHDLGFAGQAPERSRVHNPVAVTFKAGALVIRLLRNRPVSRSLGKGGA